MVQPCPWRNGTGPRIMRAVAIASSAHRLAPMSEWLAIGGRVAIFVWPGGTKERVWASCLTSGFALAKA
jgi:hypothetical protein